MKREDSPASSGCIYVSSRVNEQCLMCRHGVRIVGCCLFFVLCLNVSIVTLRWRGIPYVADAATAGEEQRSTSATPDHRTRRPAPGINQGTLRSCGQAHLSLCSCQDPGHGTELRLTFKTEGPRPVTAALPTPRRCTRPNEKIEGSFVVKVQKLTP